MFGEATHGSAGSVVATAGQIRSKPVRPEQRMKEEGRNLEKKPLDQTQTKPVKTHLINKEGIRITIMIKIRKDIDSVTKNDPDPRFRQSAAHGRN